MFRNRSRNIRFEIKKIYNKIATLISSIVPDMELLTEY
jgi:hypothetical protein